MSLFGRIRRSIRYRLGRHVVAPDLEDGSDEGVRRYYNSRLSDCSFLEDPQRLPNVEAVCGFVEGFAPAERFDWIVVSEVLEHLRRPKAAIAASIGC
ncbi:MAG TPA: hypothetical protein VMR21_10975 [Vicinamibacteria bacterium]|nr:hypothetical protein [Vicinamibacteria bacterium]